MIHNEPITSNAIISILNIKANKFQRTSSLAELLRCRKHTKWTMICTTAQVTIINKVL